MFEDSLIDQKIKTRRGWTSLFALALQALLIGVIVLIPLLFTQALPLNVHSVTMLVAPPPPPPPPPPPAAVPAVAHVQPKTTPVVMHQLTEPLRIPQKIAMVHESAPVQPAVAPSVGGVVGGVPGGVPGGQIGGVLNGMMGGTGPAVPHYVAPKKVRISQGVSEGLLVHKVMPQYPAIAKTAHIQGDVILQAEIGKGGKVQSVQVLKGQKVLIASAVSAVKQWRYKPYYLNGTPVAVETTITVDFRLNA